MFRYDLGTPNYAPSSLPYITAPFNCTPHILCDSYYYYTRSIITGSYEHLFTTHCTYDDDNDLVDYNYLFVGTSAYGESYSSTHELTSYNLLGQITRLLAIVKLGSSWDTSLSGVFYYNEAHLLSSDTMNAYVSGSWIPFSATAYTYDGSGNLLEVDYSNFDTATLWQPAITYYFTYYPGNSLKTITRGNYPGGSYSRNQVDSFGYTAAYTQYIYHAQTAYNAGGAVTQVIIDTKHLSSALGLPDTMFTYNVNTTLADTSVSLQVPYYNSFKNPDSIYYYTNIANDSLPPSYSGRTLFYYEPYEAAAVRNVAPQLTLSVYPNPARDAVFIDGLQQNGNDVHIRLTTIAGQKVRSESIMSPQPKEEFPLTQIAPGTYILTVYDHNGAVLATQTIVKQ